MFGVRGSGLTLALVGWLWADILLGLFVLFLAAANGAPTLAAVPQQSGIDPNKLAMTKDINGPVLIGADPVAALAERERLFVEVQRDMALHDAAGRKAALVLVFATNESPDKGDKIAEAVAGTLNKSNFDGCALDKAAGPSTKCIVRTFHELAPLDRGTSVTIEVYFYE